MIIDDDALDVAGRHGPVLRACSPCGPGARAREYDQHATRMGMAPDGGHA